MSEPSKLKIAEQIFIQHYEHGLRSSIIGLFQDRGIGENVANSYYQKLKTQYDPEGTGNLKSFFQDNVDNKYLPLPDSIEIFKEFTWEGYATNPHVLFFVDNGVVVAQQVSGRIRMFNNGAVWPYGNRGRMFMPYKLRENYMVNGGIIVAIA
jgi:hypothetical protein